MEWGGGGEVREVKIEEKKVKEIFVLFVTVS